MSLNAYSFSKQCQAECDHLDRGSCRECVEKALTDFLAEGLKDYKKRVLSMPTSKYIVELARVKWLEVAAQKAVEMGDPIIADAIFAMMERPDNDPDATEETDT